MPGTRIVFYKGFLDPSNPLRKGPEGGAQAHPAPMPGDAPEEDGGTPRACASCGAPTYAETCSYCRMKERVRQSRDRRAARGSR